MSLPASFTIVPPIADDAAELIDYTVRLTAEPHNNISADPGQWSMTIDKEREFIEGRNSDGAIFVVGKLAGRIVAVGQLDRGQRPTNRHSACLGLSVDASCRRLGIGSAMMEYLLNWADANGICRVWLNVFCRNTAAINLYRKFGFIEEGRHPFAFCKQGVWIDEFTMARIRMPEGAISR